MASDAQPIESAIAVFQESYSPFRDEFIQLYQREICKDEDQSIRAWDPFIVGILFRLESVYCFLWEQWWLKQEDFSVRSRMARQVEPRMDLMRELTRQFNDSRRSPLRRFHVGERVLEQLKNDPKEFQRSSELSPREKYQSLKPFVHLEQLSAIQLDAVMMAEKFRLQFNEAAVYFQKDCISVEDLNGLDVEIRGLCLPSRGYGVLNLLKRFSWLIDSNGKFERRLDDLIAEHNEKTAWVNRFLGEIDQIVDPKIREMVRSINKRRVGEFGFATTALQPV